MPKNKSPATNRQNTLFIKKLDHRVASFIFSAGLSSSTRTPILCARLVIIADIHRTCSLGILLRSLHPFCYPETPHLKIDLGIHVHNDFTDIMACPGKSHKRLRMLWRCSPSHEPANTLEEHHTAFVRHYNMEMAIADDKIYF